MNRWKKLLSGNRVKAKTNVCTCKHGHCGCWNKQLKNKIMRFLEKNNTSN